MPQTIPQRILIIGYGSELRGDDALGPRAAEALAQKLHDPRITVESCTSLTPDLAADVALADRVIFIDCNADAPPGRIHRREVKPADDGTAAMVHFLDPSALLHWARRLYGAAPSGVMFSVGGASFDIDAELSPAMQAAMPRLLRRIIAEVRTESPPPRAEVARA